MLHLSYLYSIESIYLDNDFIKLVIFEFNDLNLLDIVIVNTPRLLDYIISSFSIFRFLIIKIKYFYIYF